jgi:hypothetical protein
MLDAERTGAFDEPVHRRTVERSGPAAAIRAGESCQQLQVDLSAQDDGRRRRPTFGAL